MTATIKRNLEQKGVNVSELRPSSSLTEYLDKNFSPILEEITLTGTSPIEKIDIKRKKSGKKDEDTEGKCPT